MKRFILPVLGLFFIVTAQAQVTGQGPGVTGGGTTFPSISISGNVSTSSSLANGVGITSSTTPTYTDTSGTGGTIATFAGAKLPAYVAAANVATTYTSLVDLELPVPTLGTNASATNTYSLVTTGAAWIQGNFTAGGTTTNITGSSVNLSGIASSSAAQTGTVCLGTGGLLTYDTTTTCLASDRRLKTKVKPLESGLAEVMQLRPVSYELWPEDDPAHLGRQIGLTAQDVAEVDPRLAATYDDGPYKGTPKGVRYQQMVALLIKAIQEQQVEIDKLKKKLH
jgi:Chaperone of endosialidase